MRRLTLLAMMCWLLAVGARPMWVCAQEADAPADAPAEAPAVDAPADAPAADPPVGDAPADAPAGDAAAAPAVDAAKLGDDPAVRALIDSKPTTPIDLFRVIYYLVELQRADAAAPLAKRFLDAKPTPRDMSEILREHGSARLWRLARVEALGADGRKMIDLVLDGARAHARDPARLAELVKQLGHKAAEVRRVAMHELAAAEGDAVAMLIASLSNPAVAEQHAGIRDALVSLGKTSIPPLAAVVTAEDSALAIAAIDCLGRIGDKSAIVYLLGPMLSSDANRRAAAAKSLSMLSGREPTRGQAERLLAAEASAHLSGSVRLPRHGTDQVTLWRWDAAKREVVPQVYHHDDALAVIAERLSGELVAAAPQNEAYRRLHVMASLEMSKLVGGLDAPLAAAPKADAATLDAVLANALAQRRLAAAIGAAEALAKSGAEDLLARGDGRAATLVDAVRDPDRRVRFAALSAIMEIAPRKPYAGSSSVAEALAYFVASDGRNRALVVHPRSHRAETLASFAESIGFDADAAMMGRGGRMLLNQSADYEFVLVDLGVDNPLAYHLLGELRRDPRTAQLPIGIMAGDGMLPRAKRLAAAFDRTVAFPQATDAATIQKQADQLMALHGRHAVSAAVRERQAELALAWIVKLSAQSQAVYDLSRCETALLASLGSPSSSAAAAEALANLGTHNAQRALVDLASQSTRPISVRQAAAKAFAKSVPRRGVQLTSEEIVRQYDRYNASRDMNEATQTLLGQILDAIEAPREAARKKHAAAQKASLER
jgi:hypothetical protein